MSQAIDAINKLKDSAKGNRTLGEEEKDPRFYDHAIKNLDEAIALARKAWEDGGADDPKQRNELLRQLADCHGMKGGVYRRWDNRLDEALAMPARATADAARGVEVTQPPRTEPWGLREMWLADPDGVSIVVVEVPEDHPLRRRL